MFIWILRPVIFVTCFTFVTCAYNSFCFDCTNYASDKYYDFCPKNGPAQIKMAFYGACDGPCYYRGDAKNDSVIVRGCTSTLGTLPSPLPQDGCYDWNGAIFCVCWTPLCNMVGLPDKSSGVSLDAHLYGQTVTAEPGSVLTCFQCLNYNDKGEYYPQCPLDGRVNVQTVYSGNCTGACFIRNFKDDPKKVARGCTSSQYGLPYPLPKDGCYDYDGNVWCICTTPGCNGGPVGRSSGIEFDAHLEDIVEDIVEEDGINKCYQCINYDMKGNYYRQCPKYTRVRNAYFGPCNGTCFIRSYDYDEKLVARGCSDNQYGLPNPLPPDGCYKWYSEVWCVCSSSRCNGVGLGTPKNIEFDAHIKKSGGGENAALEKKPGALTLVLILMIMTRAQFFTV
ncbi:uncharacterized protein LOC131935584 [Physella acuta]|uniref:uncharacterized protein LOC131935584 n=1 Tax=Physella acuta TaxID=109671 RepID=UPI0027DB23C9|nr:uncharacterized protein LOC131935584 [Physella acuta]